MIFHVFINFNDESFIFICTYTSCMCKKYLLTKREHFRNNRQFHCTQIYTFLGFSIHKCYDTVPLQIKIESCSNNNCNSNKDIKKAYIHFVLLLGKTRSLHIQHTVLYIFLTSPNKIPLSADIIFMEDVNTPQIDFSFS